MPGFVAGRWEDACIGTEVMQKTPLQAMMEIDR